MPRYYSDDPGRDADRYDADCLAWLHSRPECCNCGAHIPTVKAYNIDGAWYCDQCEEAAMRDAWDLKKHTYHIVVNES